MHWHMPYTVQMTQCYSQRVLFGIWQGDVAIKPSPLASLHVHRRVLGVIGILHCPSAQDLDKAYSQFQQLCR